ncbi:hypothetical protein GCM10010298_16820 [Streptomyces microflavus]|uniref:Uncharacterized protein n=1 Tax=Streptomyces microflavus TaxID=1919 RepID=A0A7J0CUA8_STRMI|nr:hypothetical protein Smic_41100 [Streptomyces microflavus]GGX53516.1 hypothetical protein GCM10010298_16820 [Streptomyces microflavus]
MSDTTDWLSAAGGIVGAVGGPAGLWAAWNQHRANRRRRYGPPEALVGLLAKIIDIGRDVAFSFRDQAWLDASGLSVASDRMAELVHLVRNESLAEDLTLVGAQVTLVLGAVPHEFQSRDSRTSTVAKQARYADQLVDEGRECLEKLRRHM